MKRGMSLFSLMVLLGQFIITPASYVAEAITTEPESSFELEKIQTEDGAASDNGFINTEQQEFTLVYDGAVTWHAAQFDTILSFSDNVLPLPLVELTAPEAAEQNVVLDEADQVIGSYQIDQQTVKLHFIKSSELTAADAQQKVSFKLRGKYKGAITDGSDTLLVTDKATNQQTQFDFSIKLPQPETSVSESSTASEASTESSETESADPDPDPDPSAPAATETSSNQTDTEMTTETTTETTTSETATTNSQAETTTDSSEVEPDQTTSQRPLIELPPVKAPEANLKKAIVPAAEEGTDIRTLYPSSAHPDDTDGSSFLTGQTITYYDPTGTTPVTDPTIDSVINDHFDFTIPSDIVAKMKNGDYYSFDLPPQFKLDHPISGDLVSGDGTTFGTFTIDENGKVTLTFTSDQLGHGGAISGTLDVNVSFDQNEITDPGQTIIDPPSGSDLGDGTVIIKPNVTSPISKTGSLDAGINPQEATWNVTVNKTLNHIEDPTVTEHFPAGVTYDSVVIYPVKIAFDGTETVDTAHPLTSPADYTVDANGNVTFTHDIDSAYQLTYTTKVDPGAINDIDGGDLALKNTADFDGSNIDTISATATVDAHYGKRLNKSEAGYDPNNQVFDWNVDFNYGEQDIPAGYTLNDTMSPGMSYVDGSLAVYPVTFDENGQEIVSTTPMDPSSYELVPKADGSGFTIKFLDGLDHAVKIKYQSKIDGTVTDNDDQYTNEINIVGDPSYPGSDGTANPHQQNVIKDLVSVDYDQKTADWQIEVNNNHYQMNDWQMTDTLSPGLIFQPDTLVVKDSSGKIVPNVSAGGTDGFILVVDPSTPPASFTIKFVGSFADTKDNYVITYQTQLDLSPDPNHPGQLLYPSSTNNVDTEWKEGPNGPPYSSSDGKTITPPAPIQQNGAKGGDYDATDKTITWQLQLNNNQMAAGGATVTDPMTAGQKFIDGSLHIYEGVVDPETGEVTSNGTEVTRDFAVTEPSASNGQTLTLTLPDPTSKAYYVEFKTSLDGIIIDDVNDFTNVADYSVPGGVNETLTGKVDVYNNGKFTDKSGEHDPHNQNYYNWQTVINASQSTLTNAKIIDTPSNNQVIDPNSIKLYTTTVTADGTITSTGSTLTYGTDYDYSLTTDPLTGTQKLTIWFLPLTSDGKSAAINQTYILDYRVKLMLENTTEQITNSIYMTYGDDNQSTPPTNIVDDVTVVTGSGTVVGTKGKVTIEKQDAVTHAPMAGIKFELWDKTNTIRLREGTTGANGELTFGNLVYDEYLLKEVATADHYTINAELLQGVLVKVDDDSQNITLTKYNSKNAVILNKYAGVQGSVQDPDSGTAAEDQLPGAIFILKNTDTGEYYTNAAGQSDDVTWSTDWSPNQTDAAEFTTDSAGLVKIYGLLPGNYQFIETKAPDGYVLNDLDLSFAVTEKTVQVGKNSVENVPDVNVYMKNYKGSAKLLKKGEHYANGSASQSHLAGAVFSVFDEQGIEVQSGLTANAQGIVEANYLAPGTYYFKETKAAPGYVLNDQPSGKFTIMATTTGEPEVIMNDDGGNSLELTNYKGSALLNKKVDESGNDLAGAVFDVWKVGANGAKDTIIAAGTLGVAADQLVNFEGTTRLKTDRNGQILVHNLAPGKYYFLEHSQPKSGQDYPSDGAPGGYLSNPTKIEFTIAADTTNEPQLIDTDTELIDYHGRITFKKNNSDGTLLSGAEFNIYPYKDGWSYDDYLDNGTPINQSPLTDSDGIYLYGDDTYGLSVGDYALIETKAATATIGAPGDSTVYMIYENPVKFTITEQAATTNDATLEVILHQWSKGDDPSDWDNYFTNYIRQGILYKTDYNGNSLAGAVFDVYIIKDHNGNEIDPPQLVKDNLVSDQNGVVQSGGLAAGSYYFIETKAPTGYVLNETKMYFTLEPKVEGAGAPVDVVATNPDTGLNGEQLFQNDKNYANGYLPNYRVAVQLLKTDVKGNPIIGGTGAGYPGGSPAGPLDRSATFDLFQADANNKPIGTAIYKGIQTDANGILTYPQLDDNNNPAQEPTVTMPALVPGEKYMFVETHAPNGYLLNEDPSKLVFTAPTEADGKPVILEVTQINYQGKVQFTKENENKEPIKGVTFDLYSGKAPNGTLVKAGIVSDANGLVTYPTLDANGTELDPELAPGDYYFVETSNASDGTQYVLSDQPIAFNIPAQANGKPGIALQMHKQINYLAAFSLMKQTESGVSLPDAIFTLTPANAAGTTVFTTDANGKLTINNLSPGSYSLKETSTPEVTINGITGNYVLRDETITFTVAATADGKPTITDYQVNGGTATADPLIDYLGSAELATKVDEVGNPLAGATFKVIIVDIDAGGQADPATAIDTSVTVIDGGDGTYSAAQLPVLPSGKAYQFVETAAPAGYLINPTPSDPFTILTSAAGTPAAVNVTWSGSDNKLIDYGGRVQLQKYLEQADGSFEPATDASGVTFSLYPYHEGYTTADEYLNDPALKAIATGLTPNAKGIIHYGDEHIGLDAGDYVFVETNMANGYIRQLEPVKVTVSSNATGEGEATGTLGEMNNYKGSAQMQKFMADGKSPLAGATFEVWQELPGLGDQKYPDAVVTETDGVITATNLAPGTYYFKEVNAPAGYLINTDSSKLHFVIAADSLGEPVMVTQNEDDVDLAMNDYQGSAQITKYGADGKMTLAGAKFEVWQKVNGTDQLVSTAVITERDGTTTASNLAPGDYYFKEVQAPTGYIINTKTIPFTIANNAAGQPVAVMDNNDGPLALNNYQGSAKFRKLDGTKADITGLAGAEFTLQRQDTTGNWVDIAVYTSDTDGWVTAKALMPGNYRFIETKAPDGYYLNPTPISFAIPESNAADQEYVATVDQATLIDYKVNAVFTKIAVTKDHDDVIQQTPMGGVSFGIYKGTNPDLSQAPLATASSDSNGQVLFENLDADTTYTIVEMDQQGSGFNFVHNLHQIVFTTPAADSTTDGKPSTINAVSDDDVKNNFYNYKNAAELRKTGESASGKVPLAGAVFAVYDADTNEVVLTKDDLGGEGLTSNAAGVVRAYNLSPGRYYFKEVGTTGDAAKYLINDQPSIPFVIPESELDTPVLVTADENGDTLALKDYQGSAELLKTDEGDRELAGAVFEVWNKDTNEKVDTVTSNTNGLVQVAGLKPGNYYFKEITAPVGYAINDQLINFVIPTSAAGELPPVTVDSEGNRLTLKNYHVNAEITKTAADGITKLTGAKFGVYSKDGTALSNPITEVDGVFTVTGLAPNTEYYFQEVQAPAGYILNTDKIDFKTSASGTDQITINAGIVKNYQGSAELIKTNATGQRLAGAVFEVWNKDDDERVATVTSSADGLVQVSGLKPGNYYFKEITAPTDYAINDQLIEFVIPASAAGELPTVTVDPDGNSLTLSNYRVNALITKTAADGVAKLSGATFELYTKDGTKVNNPITEVAGVTTVTGLAPNTEYYFQEVKAPDGYILNTDKIVFTTPASGTGQITVNTGVFKNYQGSAELIKTDENGQELAGAVFEVWNKDMDERIATVTSSAAGLVQVSDLKPGDYYFKEITAPADYAINDQLIEFVIPASAAGEVPTVTFDPDGNPLALTNYHVNAAFTKTAADGTTKLPGATFELYTKDGTKLNNPISEVDGVFTVTGLAPNTEYYLQETKAPGGYILNTNKIVFTTPTSGTGQITVNAGVFKNYQGSAEVKKYAEDGKTLLPGAKFEVWQTVNGQEQKVTTAVISETGGVTTALGLAPGDYYFKEVQAPNGYILNTKELPFTIPDKAAGVPVAVTENTDGPLALNNYRGSAKFRKLDGAKAGTNGLAGAKFALQRQGTDGKWTDVGTFTSASDGWVTADKLMPGNYRFVERTAPNGYYLNPTPISFTIPASSADDQPFVAQVSQETLVDYKAAAVFTKIGVTRDEDDNVQQTPLSGIVFGIYKGTNPDLSKKPVATATSGSDGQVLFENLDADTTYTIVELDSQGSSFSYIHNLHQIVFTTSAADSTSDGKPATINAVASDADKNNFYNYKDAAELSKIGESAKGNVPLAGAIFSVYDADTDQVVLTVDQLGGEDLISNADGIVRAYNLSPGRYYFKEVGTTGDAADYLLNEQNGVPFEIPESELDEPVLVTTAENGDPLVLTNYQGSAQVKKYAEDGTTLLAGAKFEVWQTVNGQEQKVDTAVINEAAGVTTAENLVPGEYYFKEVQAPTGYILDETTDDLHFVIDSQAQGAPDVVTTNQAGTPMQMLNYQGRLQLLKTDRQTGTVLQGAIFKLIDENGQAVADNLVTDPDGKVAVAHLAPGNYRFVETKAPTGYQLNEQPSEVINVPVVYQGAYTAMITMTNEKTPAVPSQPNTPTVPSQPSQKGAGPTRNAGTKYPLTGEQRNQLLLIAGIGIIVVAGGVIYRRRKQK